MRRICACEDLAFPWQPNKGGVGIDEKPWPHGPYAGCQQFLTRGNTACMYHTTNTTRRPELTAVGLGKAAARRPTTHHDALQNHQGNSNASLRRQGRRLYRTLIPSRWRGFEFYRPIRKNASTDPTWHLEHEAGHTLNLAAFGSIFHFIGPIDENVTGGDANAYSKRLAESNDPATTQPNIIPMWV